MGERVGQIAKVSEVKQSNSNSRVRRTKRLQSIDTPADHILFLQRTAGNQAVSRLMKSGALQARLRIGQPGNVYKQEAKQVMRMPEPRVQRRAEEEEELVQPKLAANAEYSIQCQVEEEYHGFGGWLHKEIYEPLQKGYSAWMSWGETLPSRWGEEVPVLGHVLGIVGFIPWVLGGAMKIIVGIPQFVTPKTQVEHFLAAMTMGIGTSPVRIGKGLKYGLWWIKNLFKKKPVLKEKIWRTAPILIKKVIEKVKQIAPTVIKKISVRKVSAVVTKQPSKVWDLYYGTIRGKTIENYIAKLFKRTGDIRRLPKTFKAIDFVAGGKTRVIENSKGKWIGEVIEDAIGISEKSIDLRGKSFQTSKGTYNSLYKYFIQLHNFTNCKRKGIEVQNLKEKVFNIRYGPGELSKEQADGIVRFIDLCTLNNIKVNISIF